MRSGPNFPDNFARSFCFEFFENEMKKRRRGFFAELNSPATYVQRINSAATQYTRRKLGQFQHYYFFFFFFEKTKLLYISHIVYRHLRADENGSLGSYMKCTLCSSQRDLHVLYVCISPTSTSHLTRGPNILHACAGI